MKNVKGMIAAVMMMLIALSATAQVARPKLVVGLVVDQMRWDYLYVYNNMYGEGGLKRMLRDGFFVREHHDKLRPDGYFHRSRKHLHRYNSGHARHLW